MLRPPRGGGARGESSAAQDAARSGGKLLAATLGRGIWVLEEAMFLADVDDGSGDGVLDGLIDESDFVAFLKWMGDSDVGNLDAEKHDLRADVDGDGLVTVGDYVLFLKAYQEGW